VKLTTNKLFVVNFTVKDTIKWRLNKLESWVYPSVKTTWS